MLLRGALGLGLGLLACCAIPAMRPAMSLQNRLPSR
jgi:hypothetical protein